MKKKRQGNDKYKKGKLENFLWSTGILQVKGKINICIYRERGGRDWNKNVREIGLLVGYQESEKLKARKRKAYKYGEIEQKKDKRQDSV